jgi:CheY-like chemotaxis protein
MISTTANEQVSAVNGPLNLAGCAPAVAATKPAAVELVTAAPQRAERRRFLVAEDDPLTLRMVSAIVETEGYQAVPVTDGLQALESLVLDGSVYAAILDMKMPHLQGLDLIVYMKSNEQLRRIPVGMITAARDPKVWDESVAAGACAILPKPFTPAQVQMMIRLLAKKGA